MLTFLRFPFFLSGLHWHLSGRSQNSHPSNASFYFMRGAIFHRFFQILLDLFPSVIFSLVFLFCFFPDFLSVHRFLPAWFSTIVHVFRSFFPLLFSIRFRFFFDCCSGGGSDFVFLVGLFLYIFIQTRFVYVNFRTYSFC